MITLQKVNEKTFYKLVKMDLEPPQNKYVAPNVYSLAQAWLYDYARPYAIMDDEEPVGFVMLGVDEKERTISLWRMMIATAHQGKGYGRKALVEAIQIAKQESCFDLMYLDYVKGNDAARTLYASVGFIENGKEEDGEVIMTLKLTDQPSLGYSISDLDDEEELTKLLGQMQSEGVSFDDFLKNEENLKELIEKEKIIRFTIYGDAVGLHDGKQIAMLPEFDKYRVDASKIVKELIY